MKQLISDETKVKKLKQNPTKSREDSLLTYLLKLRKDGIFDDVTFKRYFHEVLLYGLPKVHKSGSPFRPVVSSVNTYNYLTIIP